MNKITYIDLHSHLHDKAFDEDREEVINVLQTEGLVTLAVGTDALESKKAIALAEQYDNIYATVGMHPVDNREEVFDVELYREMLMHVKVVALGECGLDYYWPTEEHFNSEAEKERQKKLFQEQIVLSVETGKPLMLHGRPSKGSMDAYVDMIALLTQAKQNFGIEAVRGNVHFFVGDKTIAEEFLKLGFTMSFSGVITFAKEYEEVIKIIPLTMMHAETDSPYAAPLPYRGRRNQPLYVKEIIAKIAEIKGVSSEEVRVQFLENAQRVFRLTF